MKHQYLNLKSTSSSTSVVIIEIKGLLKIKNRSIKNKKEGNNNFINQDWLFEIKNNIIQTLDKNIFHLNPKKILIEMDIPRLNKIENKDCFILNIYICFKNKDLHKQIKIEYLNNHIENIKNIIQEENEYYDFFD